MPIKGLLGVLGPGVDETGRELVLADKPTTSHLSYRLASLSSNCYELSPSSTPGDSTYHPPWGPNTSTTELYRLYQKMTTEHRKNPGQGASPSRLPITPLDPALGMPLGTSPKSPNPIPGRSREGPADDRIGGNPEPRRSEARTQTEVRVAPTKACPTVPMAPGIGPGHPSRRRTLGSPSPSTKSKR